MTDDSDKQISLVRRITIDEKLEGDLIHILIANLKESVTTFSDNSTYWEEEEELFNGLPSITQTCEVGNSFNLSHNSRCFQL